MKGERLPERKVLAIIEDLRTTMTYKAIAYKHDVLSVTVRNINTGMAYRKYTDGFRIRRGRGNAQTS